MQQHYNNRGKNTRMSQNMQQNQPITISRIMYQKLPFLQCFKTLIWDALRHGDDVPQWNKPRFFALLTAWFIISMISLVLLIVGKQISSDGLALTRYMARGQATISGQWAYPDLQRDQIEVVLFDQDYLDGMGTAWPISYGLHADFLEKLAERPDAIPRALLLDVTFHQPREAADIALLRETLCRIHKQFGVLVYLAALPDSQTGRLAVRPELMAPIQGDRHDCYTLVGVDYRPDAVDGVAWTYELNRHFDGHQWMQGPQPHPGRHAAYKSAAQTMAEDLTGIDLSSAKEPMALMWGSNGAHPPGAKPRCQVQHRRWQQFLPDVVMTLLEDPPSLPPCPYHRSHSAMDVLNMEDSELGQLTRDKILVIGAQVPGYNDFAQSPVHGLIPGPHMHAMAIDNLLTFGERYKRNIGWAYPMNPLLLATTFLLISMVFWVTFGIKLLHTRFRPYFVSLVHKTWGRLLLARGAAWTFKMLVISALVLVLVAMLQRWLPLGLLPVTELVSMTVLAEALGYLAWLKRNLEPASTPTDNKETT